MFKTETLSNNTILITGGGSGLGLSMAKKFASLGANVAICGRTEEKLKRATAEIREAALADTGSEIDETKKKNTQDNERQSGSKEPKFRYYVADVRDFDRVYEMVNQVTEDFGSMEGLVNNAAGNFLCASEDLSPGGFKAVVDIVLQGTFNCTHAFGNYLIGQKKTGNILNIVVTYAERTGSAFVLPSACSKAGVLTMTRSLAYEWATYGIRLNAIAPGPFPTEGAWSRLIPSKKYEKKFLEKIPMRRYGEHEELANLAVFLMSDMAEYITGECVTIDGGEQLVAGQFNFIDQLMSRDKLKKMFKMMK